MQSDTTFQTVSSFTNMFVAIGKGQPLQYSGLENSMDGIVHRVTKSQTQLSNCHFHFVTINTLFKKKSVGKKTLL